MSTGATRSQTSPGSTAFIHSSIDTRDRLLTGRGLDEQLQERRFARSRTAESSTVASELAECQVDRADGALVADTHAIAPMNDATSCTPARYPARPADANAVGELGEAQHTDVYQWL